MHVGLRDHLPPTVPAGVLPPSFTRVITNGDR